LIYARGEGGKKALYIYNPPKKRGKKRGQIRGKDSYVEGGGRGKEAVMVSSSLPERGKKKKDR